MSITRPFQPHLIQTAPGRYEARLSGGVLTMEMHREEVPLPELCDFALRRNARRRFLFVSRVLGRHMPTRPGHLRDAAARLARKIAAGNGRGPVLFFGMSETATTLAQAVYAAWHELGCAGLYIESTRRRTGGSIAFEFVESHSHASAHLVHLPSPEDDPEGVFQKASRVVVVDDEATTGRTAAGLAAAYAAWRGIPVEAMRVELAVLARWNPPQGAAPLGEVTIHTLLDGAFEFRETGVFPEAPAQVAHADVQSNARCGARHGLSRPQEMPWSVKANPGERILVLGTGEFGYQPQLLASALEGQGATAWVQATTRSPVLTGGAIGHSRTFPSLTGEGHPEFLYNVPDDHPYDRVLLCCEDTLLPSDHPLRQVPRIEILPLPDSLPS
ncbi:phosphoribosyltransferase-like predicted ribonucleoside biosynthesis protein [Roseimicrobium gellanilyticum]|uniref:Phosphoribosyltransferase-like predicted ribonucleoside biosynthesis protein n=1 Tax=Roseimicrobium gellanilyticum TaxID=748857 RepID=A0A366HQX6_9BACT|nr:phosphoribosyltransferase domain-containing protein [Roseimicrobium gellanilyticum]RBP44604.1 phosphoribosyltransferase-like predicted ribonucleoside biosynthesis protein [Roseimicrobium gellanilyticum]